MIILFQAREQNKNQIMVDVNVKENPGVFSMLLTLDYDRSAFTLTSVDYGEALSSLEPLASKDYSTNPYKISYMGIGDVNDTSTGRMMTLTFTVNENAPDGEYKITFDYEKTETSPILTVAE